MSLAAANCKKLHSCVLVNWALFHVPALNSLREGVGVALHLVDRFESHHIGADLQCMELEWVFCGALGCRVLSPRAL